jgi:molybdopterin-guanine dinucleotide biosynthesis protein A
MKAAQTSSLGGIILAGGASRRMGRDKATLPWGESTLLEHLSRQFRPLTPLVIVGPHDRNLPSLPGLTMVYDDAPFSGPLAGLVRGLACFPEEAVVLVTGCDYPLLTMSLVLLLHEAMNEANAVVLMKDGVRQPLPLICRASILPYGSSLLQEGHRSLQVMLDNVNCKAIEESIWQAWPEVDTQLVNLNTPDDYQQALQRSLRTES